jgi:uncharacterized membrane protein YecN with MAPEG domain
MSVPEITILFVGLLAVLQIPLTVIVGLRRRQTGIQFFDGGDQVLLRRMRAHANFTETVPITLLAMAAAELTSAPPWALWLGGFSLLVGRIIHAAIIILKGWGLPRAIGMLLTLAPMLGFGLWAVLHGFPRGAA